jgi:hypothetical protein
MPLGAKIVEINYVGVTDKHTLTAQLDVATGQVAFSCLLNDRIKSTEDHSIALLQDDKLWFQYACACNTDFTALELPLHTNTSITGPGGTTTYKYPTGTLLTCVGCYYTRQASKTRNPYYSRKSEVMSKLELQRLLDNMEARVSTGIPSLAYCRYIESFAATFLYSWMRCCWRHRMTRS